MRGIIISMGSVAIFGSALFLTKLILEELIIKDTYMLWQNIGIENGKIQIFREYKRFGITFKRIYRIDVGFNVGLKYRMPDGYYASVAGKLVNFNDFNVILKESKLLSEEVIIPISTIEDIYRTYDCC